jgi:predicted O-linked N-acetylglucosamine transferase (SPINDLY family)
MKAVCDVSLDTFPYGAHSTAAEVLWSGIPHVTMAGDASPSRVGLSLLEGTFPSPISVIDLKFIH